MKIKLNLTVLYWYAHVFADYGLHCFFLKILRSKCLMTILLLVFLVNKGE